MKTRKLLTEIASQSIIKRQHSQLVNSKYITFHEYTALNAQQNTSLEQLTSVSLQDCLEELDAHLVEQRPMQNMFVVQIKKHLGQLQSRGGEQNLPLKRKLKQFFQISNEPIQSPYKIHRSLKKFKIPAAVENQPTDYRTKLKRKKINYQNTEIQNLHKITLEKQQKQRIESMFKEKSSLINEKCVQLRGDTETMKHQFLVQIEAMKSFFSTELQQARIRLASEIQRKVSFIQLQHQKSEQSLQRTIVELQAREREARQESIIISNYLQEREAELLTIWSSLNLQPK